MEKNWYPIVPFNDPIELYLSTRITKAELYKLRKSHRLTQRQVSEATGLSMSCISDIESESAGNPTLKSVQRYLACFGYELSFTKKKGSQL